MQNGPVRVAVVSAQPVVRAGLVALLEENPDHVTVVELATGFDVQQPDVVLYDVIGLLESDGSDLDDLVKESSAAVLAVSRDLRPDLASRALARGADGFFSIEVDAEGLLAAVTSAMTGWAPGDLGENPTVGSSDFEAREHRLGHDVGLTDREVQTLALVTQGLSNQEIAEQCYLSINSVKTYIRSAYRRIGATSRSQAVIWCLQHGFAPDRESID